MSEHDNEDEECETCPGFTGGGPLPEIDCTDCPDTSCPPGPDQVVPTVTQDCCDPCGPTQTHSYATRTGCSPEKLKHTAKVGCSPIHEFPVPVPPSGNLTSRDAFAEINLPFTYPGLGVGDLVRIINIKLTEGQYLFHPYYGALYVNQVVNEVDGIYDLKNLGASPLNETVVGKIIPCKTKFALGVIASETSAESLFTCNSLTADFHIPAVQSTSPAKVSSFSGFVLGGKVLLRNKYNPANAYTYDLVSFSGIDTLVLKNVGQGGTPGQVLKSDDGDGELAWCLESLADIPLSEQAVSTQCMSSFLGFDEDGNLQKITATLDNEVLAYDIDCGGFTRKVVPNLTKCVNLVTAFQITPLPNVCNRQQSYITTSDDNGLLAAARASRLTTNAEPIIYICGYSFAVDVANSVFGQIRVTPLFNPPTVVMFGTDCTVCIPEDCCSQCNPQVAYPQIVIFPPKPPTANFPPGIDNTISFVIPRATLNAVGERRYTAVKNAAGTENLTLQHANTGENPGAIAAFNQNGATVAIPSNSSALCFQNFKYYHYNDVCPIVMEYKEDYVMDFLNIPAGVTVNLAIVTEIGTFLCGQLGVKTAALSATRTQTVRTFTGPSKQSAVSTGEDAWFGSQSPGTFRSYDKTDGGKQREVTLFYPNAMYVETRIYIAIKVDTVPAASDFIYGTVSGTSIFKASRI